MPDLKGADFFASRQLHTAFIKYWRQFTEEERHYRDADCSSALQKAKTHESDGNYERAARTFAEALSHLVGAHFNVPMDATQNGGVWQEAYAMLSVQDTAKAMSCANGASRCHLAHGNLTQALDWALETDAMYRNAQLRTAPLFDWQTYHPSPLDLEFCRQRILGLLHASDVFLKAWNTGSAEYCRHTADQLVLSLPPNLALKLRREVLQVEKLRAVQQWRHPDPFMHLKHVDVVDPNLQVRGAWQKLKVTAHSRIASRMGHSSFVYNNRLYVGGGQCSRTFQTFRDLWYLDLKRLDRWRELPSCPFTFVNCKIVIHGSKAYLIRGDPLVDVFDLEHEFWDRIITCFADDDKVLDWPWMKLLDGHAVVLAQGKIYVFGGASRVRPIGSDFFAELDLQTEDWTPLSGLPDTAPLRARHDSPGVRKLLAAWTDRREERVYVMYGMPDHQEAFLAGHEWGDMNGSAIEDCWSWGIKERKWRRERIAGNYPCPRAEMATCYNPKINGTIMYGGYSPSLPFYPGGDDVYDYQYLSDTFLLDHSSPTPRWRQILTPSFPTYRAQCQIVADPVTGKMYLFGGYTNTTWCPAGKYDISRSYGDIWELVVDVPGGNFTNVDWEDEKRTAQLGPWQVCYTCGKFEVYGSYKKCAGSCDGHVVYCSSDCQKKGWPAHKEKHKCKR